MRLLLLLLLFLTNYATAEETCYTVQLFSIPATQKKDFESKHKQYPSECQLMQISKTLTMRCGCYERIKDANSELLQYKERYHHAVVSISYKKRFQTKQVNNQAIDNEMSHNIKNNNKDYELRLMLQAFLYSQDLEHARETAKLALKKDPTSLYWNQKMAEILRWMGRDKEALQHMKFIYYQTKKPQLANKIIDYALSNYQYEHVKKLMIQEFLKNPNEKNRKRVLFLFNQLGEPQKAAKLFLTLYNTTKDPELLTTVLQIYMDLGDLKNAKNVIDIIELDNLYTQKNIRLISYYYYIQKNIFQAYKVLKKFNFQKNYNKSIMEQLSDFAWYLQKYKDAANASLLLIQHKNSRLVDFERVMFTYQEKDPALTLKIALLAFKKFHANYLFFNFANQALLEHHNQLLKKAINIIETKKLPLLEDANFWIIKARLYLALKQKSSTLQSLTQALQLEPNNTLIQLQALNIYLKLSMYKEVNSLLTKLTEHKEISQSYLLPIASLYFSIHNVNQANFYLDKLKEQHSPLITTLQFKFLQAEVYKAELNHNAYIQILYEIKKILDNQQKEDPKILHTDKYLYNKLRIALYLKDIDSFKKELKENQKYLTKKHFDDLSYSYAIHIGAKNLAHEIYLKTQQHPIWLDFANAMQEQNHTTEMDLLFHYLEKIPRDDASYTAHKNGEISLSQSLSFLSLQDNSKNTNAYISMLNYSKERSNLFSIKSSYYNRDPLLRKYINITNALYIYKGFSLYTTLNNYKNSSLDQEELTSVPSTTEELNLGVGRIFDKGELKLILGHTKSMKSYTTMNLYGRYAINNYITIQTKLEKNGIAAESTQLLLGGKKDMLRLRLLYKILLSTTLEITMDQNRYTAQDNTYIGKGTYLRAILGHQIHNGYPDMRVSLFSDYGRYSEVAGNKGCIENLGKYPFKVLPDNFYTLGATFNYGMQNSKIYTRVWRPYFELSSYYNSSTSTISYGFHAGYGGKVYLQDHCVVGINYTNDVNSVGGSILEFFLKYQFLYTH